MKDATSTVSKVLILAFPVLFSFFFFLLPIFKIILLAFGIELENNFFFTFSFFIDVITDSLIQYFLYWDIQQALVTTGFCIMIGLPGSYIFAHYKFYGKSFLRNLLTVPFILPPIVVLIGFMSVFGNESWINQVWKGLTGSILIDIFNSYEGIILAHTFYNIPVIIRLVEIGWKNIDPELISVARSLKASKRQIFMKIQLPQLFPILAAASLLVFIYAFNSFAIVLVLGGINYQTLEVRINLLAKSPILFDINRAAALTIIQLFINLLVIIAYLYFSNKYEVPISATAQKIEQKLISFPLTMKITLRLFLVTTYFISVGMVCLLPLIGVFIYSFTSVDGSFTLSNYETILSRNISSYIESTPQNMISITIMIGIGVMILATILAVLLNHGLNYETSYKGTPKLTLRQSLGGILIILPLAVSSITLAFSLYSLYSLTPIYKNVNIAIIIAQTLVAFPFANRIIAATRATIDPTVINVARSLGASRFKTFMRIELPLMLPGIIVAGLFSFAISIGEFGATYFLSRPNFATIPVGIYRIITRIWAVRPAAALSAILIIVTVISFMIIERFGKLELRF